MDNRRYKTEIRSRMVKAAFNKRKELLTKNMGQTMKKKIMKAMIWSMFLYESETWTMKSAMILEELRLVKYRLREE